jgi:hypothetical protein
VSKMLEAIDKPVLKWGLQERSGICRICCYCGLLSECDRRLDNLSTLQCRIHFIRAEG